MGFNRIVHHRQSIRLRDYDYAQPNAYFVTICAHQKQCLFGEVTEEGEMRLNEVGKIIGKEWYGLVKRFSSVDLDEFVVMPNHIHGIIWIRDIPKNDRVGAQFIAPQAGTQVDIELNHKHDAQSDDATRRIRGVMNHAPTLGNIIRTFKAASTYKIHRILGNEPVWQRNYYEHIIRSQAVLDAIRTYISQNPAMWRLDQENPYFKPKIPIKNGLTKM